VDQGQILIAETKHFRVVDHQHRLSPMMEVAYDLEAPNLYAAGYAACNPRAEGTREENQGGNTFTDGTGRVRDTDQLWVTATTGNALFWGNDPHRGMPAKREFLVAKLGVPADAARNRGYTLLVDGKDIDPLRPEMARAVRVEFPVGMADGVKFVDPAGSWIWTEARVPLKTLGKFTLRYDRMFPLGSNE